MGLVKNLRLLFSDSLLARMQELEQRQDLLEEYTSQKLDSMKVYHARVVKRERDETAASRSNDRAVAPTGLSPAAVRVLERRRMRSGTLG